VFSINHHLKKEFFMNYISILRPVLEALVLIVPVLLAVAYVTVAERKTMASMQRRLGPNAVGYYGLLQLSPMP